MTSPSLRCLQSFRSAFVIGGLATAMALGLTVASYVHANNCFITDHETCPNSTSTFCIGSNQAECEAAVRTFVHPIKKTNRRNAGWTETQTLSCVCKSYLKCIYVNGICQPSNEEAAPPTMIACEDVCGTNSCTK